MVLSNAQCNSAELLATPDNATQSACSLPYFCLRVSRLCVFVALESCSPVSSFLAATIRGGLGYSLRELTCAYPGSRCSSCQHHHSCPYGYLFESSPPIDAARLRSYRDIPRPFTIRPLQAGALVIVNITLVGRAAAYAPFLIRALNRLGAAGLGKERIPFRVARVCDSKGKVVYPLTGNRMSTDVASEELVVAPGLPQVGEISLEFVTPLAVRKDGRVLANFDRDAFFATLLRRLSNLAVFYGQAPQNSFSPETFLAPARTLTVTADTWPVVMRRISTRQKRRIDYDGILGTVRLTGDIGTVMPLLAAGEMLGVGKNTVFGFGVYRIKRPG